MKRSMSPDAVVDGGTDPEINRSMSPDDGVPPPFMKRSISPDEGIGAVKSRTMSVVTTSVASFTPKSMA